MWKETLHYPTLPYTRMEKKSLTLFYIKAYELLVTYSKYSSSKTQLLEYISKLSTVYITALEGILVFN